MSLLDQNEEFIGLSEYEGADENIVAQAQTQLLTANLNPTAIESQPALNSDLTKTLIDNWQYNFQTIIGPTSIALVPSELNDWEKDNGFYLESDDFDILRKFKNGIMTPEDVDKVAVLYSASVNADNVTFANTPISTTSAPVNSVFTTDSTNPKNRIGNYYQEGGIFYKVTALGPQQVSLNEVKRERVWAENGDAKGWWTVRDDGLIEWAGETGTIRVVGDVLYQIGLDGKDNYLRIAPTADSTDPKNRIGNYYQEGGIFYKVTALGPQQVSLNEVKRERVWAENGEARGWWTVRDDGLIEFAGETGTIRVVGDALYQIGLDGKDNYIGVRVQELVKTNGQWTLVFTSEGNYGYITLYDENKNVIMSCPATSGRIGVTDRTQEDRGPIPLGSYIFDPKEISGGIEKAIERNLFLRQDWGFYRVPLTPQGVYNGRGGFFLHGGFFEGSAGCIDIGTNDLKLFPLLIQHEGLIKVEVIEGKPNDILFPNGQQYA
ncbi:MAG: hypothetical protein H6Q73_4523 [Firmicutes bacterium]|nr:hypothetical protein [Bacillota bacterium]